MRGVQHPTRNFIRGRLRGGRVRERGWHRLQSFGSQCEVASCDAGYKLSEGACVGCSVPHALSFGSGCEVASCDAGYKVSEGACVACDIPHAASYGAECAVTACAEGFSLSGDGAGCLLVQASCRAGFAHDTSRGMCMSDIESCSRLLLKQNANQDPLPAVPGTCNAIFAACSTDGNASALSEVEWNACEVDKAMDPTFVQAFAMVDNAPRDGTVSRTEYAMAHRISAVQIADLVVQENKLHLTSFRREPLTPVQAAFDHLDVDNTGKACCIAGINDGQPFVLREFSDYIYGFGVEKVEPSNE